MAGVKVSGFISVLWSKCVDVLIEEIPNAPLPAWLVSSQRPSWDPLLPPPILPSPVVTLHTTPGHLPRSHLSEAKQLQFFFLLTES